MLDQVSVLPFLALALKDAFLNLQGHLSELIRNHPLAPWTAQNPGSGENYPHRCLKKPSAPPPGAEGNPGCITDKHHQDYRGDEDTKLQRVEERKNCQVNSFGNPLDGGVLDPAEVVVRPTPRDDPLIG
jgi:hypothetical protein